MFLVLVSALHLAAPPAVRPSQAYDLQIVAEAALDAAAAAIDVPPNSGTTTAFTSGNRLLHRCTSALPVDTGWCIGIITATADAYSQTGPWPRARGVPLPPGVTSGQLQDLVVAHLRAHPDKRHVVAVELIYEALRGAFGERR